MQSKSITLLGATGSIGQSTLAILRQFPGHFSLTGVSAHQNLDKLVAICREFCPRYAAIADSKKQPALRDALSGTNTQIIDGTDCVAKLAAMPTQLVVAAMMGSVGVNPVWQAIQAGNAVALANKESLVCAGTQIMQAAAENNVAIYPLDSEHNALFQMLSLAKREEIASLEITASGGPFLRRPLETFASITPEEAVAHPRWEMGAKISIDSATMMNKGLELIEALHLFGLPAEKLRATIHPESVIHGLLHTVDGASFAQLGVADMRVPIAAILGLPDRLELAIPSIDLAALKALHFEAICAQRYPCFALAQEALLAGQAAHIILNAANEMAVAAFLAHHIRFPDIARVVASCLEALHHTPISSLEEALAFDAEVRHVAHQLITQKVA
jgi:1-deoxy-D-xylulose-5-phosphate reductoisomerase